MAFNSRKFQKLIEEEKNNAAFVDEFEDDFVDDFDDEPVTEEPAHEAADFMPENEGITEFESTVEDPVEEAEPETEAADEPEEIVEEEPAVEESPAEEEPADEPEAIVIPEPIAEEPIVEPVPEEYDPHKLWQDMAALAIKAKGCISAGAFYRANDIISAMRSLLVEMMCRANGITENFNENADTLNDDCKQDIYTSYPATLNAQSLSNAVTNIMAVTYKYI